MGFSSCRIFLLLSLLLLFIVSLFYFLFCVPVISNELQLRIKEIDIVRGYSHTIYVVHVPEIVDGMWNFYAVVCGSYNYED